MLWRARSLFRSSRSRAETARLTPWPMMVTEPEAYMEVIRFADLPRHLCNGAAPQICAARRADAPCSAGAVAV
eukprot:967-Chlamydomonas_euryale.AAC.1